MKRPHLLPALAALALAAPASAQPGGIAIASPGGPGQQALAIRAEGGAILARACAAAPCTPDGGVLLPVPDDVKPLLPGGRAATIALAGGRVVGRVDVPGGAAGSAWVMLLVAPLTGRGAEPQVLWSGWTGLSRGEHGEERSAAVLVEAAPRGGQRVLVGERRADVTLCGRPTLVAAREIDPATLDLARGASVQNLTAAERAGATKIAAARLRDPAPPPGEVRLLHATAASSAVERRFATLTDGDPATSWSENKPGDGRGEFVTIGSAEEVGITALDLIVRPTEDVPDGAAPKRLFLATPDRLFEVTMPEDAWRQPPGTRYALPLPAELHASCLAVVLDESYAPAGKAGARVTLAKIEAHTAFDGATLPALAGALAGGGARARAAAALLARAGKAGIQAAIAGYGPLDDEGKRLAAGVIDAAPCADQVSFFAGSLAAAAGRSPRAAPGDEDPELVHARDRLRRCGRAAAPALAKLVGEGKGRVRLLAADELAMVAPSEAVPVLLAALEAADDSARRDLRAALARAAKNPRAFAALAGELEPGKFKARSEAGAIDLLRAIGPSLGKVDGAGDAFGALATATAPFRTRFLLQAPAAELARAGDARGVDFLRASLRKDDDFHVRAHAAEVAGRVPALGADLVAATEDPEVRVRSAAIEALADATGEGAAAPAGLPSALVRRLADDDWTFVRAGAARALGAMPADAAIDRALAAALADASPDVRGRVLDGLGAHHATAYAEQIRARQDADDENIEVRARAILALGALCDARSLGAWTKLARAAKAPTDDKDRRLGSAAIAALGLLHPADLAARLAPLQEQDAPLVVREMAKAAMALTGTCR
jgi:HEAT repeat protein